MMPILSILAVHSARIGYFRKGGTTVLFFKTKCLACQRSNWNEVQQAIGTHHRSHNHKGRAGPEQRLGKGILPLGRATIQGLPRLPRDGAIRPRPPFNTLMVDKPIMALPPMPPRKPPKEAKVQLCNLNCHEPRPIGCLPDTMFPRPMANKERSPSLGVLVKDSTTWL